MIRSTFLLLIALTCIVRSEDKSTPVAANVDKFVASLENTYSRQAIEEALETHPILEVYLSEGEIETGKAAAMAHMERIEPQERDQFQTTLRQILFYRKLLSALTSDLTSGYHDIAFTHGQSRDLYKPFLKVYGLDSNDATAEDVASSLSTVDDARILTRLARRLALSSEDRRLAFLGDVLHRIDSVPQEQ